MTERLIRKNDIAAMLGTSPGVAAAILSERGVHPIDFGMGRSRGLHWLESAVEAALREMHAEAQPKPNNQRQDVAPQAAYPATNLAGMPVKDIHSMLTACQGVQ